MGNRFSEARVNFALLIKKDVPFKIVDQFDLTVEERVLESDLRKHQQHGKRDATYGHHQPTPIMRQVLPSQWCFAVGFHQEILLSKTSLPDRLGTVSAGLPTPTART